MKLNIDNRILNDFKIASTVEWIEINQTGCYSGSSIYGMNTRPYHGLFCFLDENVAERKIILSKIEESVFINNQVFELSTNNFAAGIHPKGYQYLTNFALDPFPEFTFRIGKQRLVKTLFLLHDANVLVVRYQVKNQGPELKLILKPLIAGRKTTEMAHESPNMNTDSYVGENVVRVEPKPEIPELSLYYHQGEYVQAPLWYHNFQYHLRDPNSKEDHSDLAEDLFNPGFFSCRLKPYESFDLYITTERKMPNMDFEAVYYRQKQIRRKLHAKSATLPAHVPFLMKQVELSQLVSHKEIPYIFQKYHSFSYTIRDFLWTLPGLLFIERQQTRLYRFIELCLNNLKNGIFIKAYPFTKDSESIGLPQADLALLFINVVYLFYMHKKDTTYLEKVLYEPCREIVDSFRKGSEFGIVVDKDGLIACGEIDKNVSGIVLKGDNSRYGQLVEFQALWYNALKIIEFFSREINKKRLAKKYAAFAEQTEVAYRDKFVDKRNSRFYDAIRDNYKDSSFRYHQIFQICLPFPLVQGDAALLLLKRIEDELLTPYGLRSLSVSDVNYIGRTASFIGPDEAAYYSGAVWPWTIGMYTDAVLNVRGNHQQVIAYLTKQLENFREVLYSGTLGFISEIYDGDEPHERNGSQVYPAILCEYIRAVLTIEYNKS